METRILTPDRPADLRAAADILAAGGLLAFPTETVYGLGARADLPDAVQRLLDVKGRPADKRMAILVSDAADIARYVAAVPPAAQRVAAHFWPGPVTLVLETAPGETTGLRCPDLDFLRTVIARVDAPVFAPSANPTGEAPALNAKEVLGYFDGRIEGVLDGGPVRVGVASTVVRVTAAGTDILREGAVSADEIERVIQKS